MYAKHDAVVVTRRVTARTVMSDDGCCTQTISNSITIKSDCFNVEVDWESMYNEVVGNLKKHVNLAS